MDQTEVLLASGGLQTLATTTEERTNHMASDQLRLILRRKLTEGQLEAYKGMALHLTADVQANEPGTLSYENYLTDDGTEAFLVVAFRNSEAFLRHHHRAMSSDYKAPDLGPFAEALVLGSPTPEAREALSWLEPKIFSMLAGFTR